MRKARRGICLLCCLLLCWSTEAQEAGFAVTRYGAVGDGRTDNTLAIQRTIDACAAAGGGDVLFPAGNFLTGTIVLRSHVTLHVPAGCQITGSTDLSRYPPQQHGVVFYGSEWAKQSLVYACNADGVGITGEGTIDGQGASFVVTTTKKPDRYRNRPYLLWFVNCKRVRVQGVTLRNSAFWMQHYLCCDDVTIRDVTVWNHSNKNNDMADIDGSRNVTIDGLKGDSDDDGLTLKSTSPRITENVTITNCILSSHCNALKLGTESTGGFRNVTISNCVIRPSAQKTIIYGSPAGTSGISLEAVDGGIMENVTITNIVMEGPEVPIFIRLGNRARKFSDTAKAPPVSSVNGIRLSHIIAKGGGITGCSITGIESAKLRDISLDDITIEAAGGGKPEDMLKTVPKLDSLYPEGTMFGTLPAYGFYVAHAENVRMHNIAVRFTTGDQRPALAFDDVQNFDVNSVLMHSLPGTPALIFIRSGSGQIANCQIPGPARSFLARTDTTGKIRLFNNFYPQIRRESTTLK